MKTIDSARIAFDEYRANCDKYFSEDLSESDTRSKIIDDILINVLGWHENDIRREGHVASGYFDYKISIPGIHFIVEAKRQYKEIKIPSNHKTVSIKSLQKGNEDIIKQIRSYAIDESIQYGVITNGRQFIFIKVFNTDSTDWKENQCLVFNGLEEVDSRFIDFFENLSKSSLITNGGFKFDLPIESVIYKTLLSSLIDKDKELIRNSLSAAITPLIDEIFGEIFSEEREDDEEFITKCFVDNEETKKNKSEIERLFGDYAPEIHEIVPIVNTKNIGIEISSEISSDEISLKNNYPPKPIIIIGSKGAGKTTFINHLFKYRVQENDLENHFLVYIDFRKFYEASLQFEPSQIAEEILESIYTKYESLQLHSLKTLIRIYIKEIKRNDENTWSWDKKNDVTAYQKRLSNFLEEKTKNSFDHLEHLSKYLVRERRKRLIIIIDNADQFNAPIQEKLFIFAHSLTKAALCGTVISLREGYFYRWQNSPPFDAYESNIYHITAPRYSEILQKRIDFALEKAPLFEKPIVRGIDNKGFKFEYSSGYIKEFLSSLKRSIFAIDNAQLIDYLNHTTYPNIREGLRVFKSFLTSGHTKVSEYILREKFRDYDKTDISPIPMHEFIKSIALQNRLYYNSEISSVYNLFIPPVNSTDHFIKLYLLQDLSEFIEKKSYTEKFISNTTIVSKLHSLGYKLNVVNSAIFSLLKAGMIDTDEQISDIDWQDLPSAYNLCLTAKGFYYLKEMIYRFHYYDLILQDTPIFDLHHFEIIKSKFPPSNSHGTRRIEKRIDCMHAIFDYLKSAEDLQPKRAILTYGSFYTQISTQVNEEIIRMRI